MYVPLKKFFIHLVPPIPEDCTEIYRNQRKILQRYTKVCRHLLSKSFKNAFIGRLEMVQCECYTNQIFAGTFVK